jgi:hypothetical protein
MGEVGRQVWPWRILLPQTLIYCYYLGADFKHTAGVIYYTPASPFILPPLLSRDEYTHVTLLLFHNTATGHTLHNIQNASVNQVILKTSGTVNAFIYLVLTHMNTMHI